MALRAQAPQIDGSDPQDHALAQVLGLTVGAGGLRHVSTSSRRAGLRLMFAMGLTAATLLTPSLRPVGEHREPGPTGSPRSRPRVPPAGRPAMSINPSPDAAPPPSPTMSGAPRLASAPAAGSPEVKDLRKRGRSEGLAAAPRMRVRTLDVDGRPAVVREYRQDEKRAERQEALEAIQLLRQR